MKPDPQLRDRARSHIANEQPFIPNITFADVPAMEAVLGLPPTKPSIRSMRAALLANVVKASRTGYSAIHYSRRRSHYLRDRYTPPGYGYRALMPAVDDLVSANLVQERRSRPGTVLPWRSRLSLIGDPSWLAEPWVQLTKTVVELVHLKDEDRVRIDYEDTSATSQCRRDIDDHNRFLSAFDIATPQLANLSANGILPLDEEEDEFPVVHSTYYRVFNRRWSLGGRWYGPWWQHVGKAVRATITIDGHPCGEYDFPSFHPQLVCAAAKVDLPFHEGSYDFYAIDQVHDRSRYKLAVNILLNATSKRSAHGALCKKLIKNQGLLKPGLTASDLINRIEAALPQRSAYWGSGVALRLQNIDGEMMSRIQKRLRDDGIPHLSVHDSVLAPLDRMHVVEQVMKDQFHRALQELRKFGLKPL